PRSLTTVIDALEEAGLVRREIDPRNRRAILLRLTDRGTAVRDDLREAPRRRGPFRPAVRSGPQDSGRPADAARSLTAKAMTFPVLWRGTAQTATGAPSGGRAGGEQRVGHDVG